jgi:GNAT superfamily N-acetyltransferase
MSGRRFGVHVSNDDPSKKTGSDIMDTTSAGAKPGKRAPLLQARHFHRRRTELRETGLHFDRLIDEHDRDHYTSLVEEEFEARTRVVVNPRALPASDLFARMNNAEAPGDRTAAYDTSWRVEENEEEIREGQQLVAVAVDGGAPVGYARFGVSVVRRKDESAIRYRLNLDFFYVLPTQRGRGIGVNLSAACAEICCDVLFACFLAARKGTTIDLDVYAEFASHGGERISNSIVRQLEEVCEYLPDTKRPGVRFGDINYDAG